MENGFSSPKVIRPKQKWFYIVELEMKIESPCRNGLHIPSFLVELLLREPHFGHTHTQKHPSTYLKSYFSKTA